MLSVARRMCGLVAVALCFALLCGPATAAADAVSPYLQVHTTDTSLAIIANGVVNPAWSIGVNGTGPYALSAVEFPTYRITSSNDTFTQSFLLTYSSSDSAIVTTSATSEQGSAKAMASYASSVETVCVATGTATVTVLMQLTSPVQTTMEWAYQKTCTLPLIEIGTQPFKSDVASKSVATAQFANWLVAEDTLELYLYLSNPQQLPPLQQPFELGLLAYTGGMFGTVTYNSTDKLTQSDIIQDASAPIGMLTIPFECDTKSGNIEVQVTIDYHWSNTLTLTFYKQCGTRTPASMVSVGSSANAADIAKAGVTTTAWNGTGYVYTPGTIIYNLFQFHLCLDCANSGTLASLPYNVSMLSLEDSSVFEMQPSVALSGTMTKQVDSPFYADVRCIANGTSTVRFQVTFVDTYSAIEFSFTYTCVHPLLNMKYGLLTNDLVVKNSVVLPVWSHDFVTITHAEHESIFYLFLNDANSPTLLPRQQYTMKVTFNQTESELPVVSDPNGLGAGYIADVKPIVIKWYCDVSSPVTISIDYGWPTPLEIRFKKNCDPESSSGGHHWTPAGIFFFTVFILALAGFIFGIAFNYFKLGKRGWTMVPLYETTVRLVDRCRGIDREWSPQLQEDPSDRSSAGTYGGFEDSASNL